MAKLQNRIETLYKVFDRWLSDDNEHLLQAVHRTVEEGYFSFPDVQFALKSLQQSLTERALETWISRSGITERNDASGQNVLCLHAGNLPLVGFQDVLAVLLSGARYSGKISRKDPYLLPAFLNEVKKTAIWNSADVQWSHRLDDFEGMQNDYILFAGSPRSISGVKKAIESLNLKKKNSRYLIRRAHFSMAYFDDKKNMDDLVQAILRYGGKGCRSVAVVVSPFSLGAIRKELSKSVQSFHNENPQHAIPAPKLGRRFAYNKAIKRKQLWLNDFLIQENGLEFDQDFICYWVQGTIEKVREVAVRFGDDLQSIYMNQPEAAVHDFAKSMPLERLEDAQQPPIYWKPDGTDILKWFTRPMHV